MKHQQKWNKRIGSLFLITTLAFLLILGFFVHLDPDKLFADSHGEIKGIDVSKWQGTVRWDLVKQSGISFAYAKATGGITYTDPEFKNNWNGMRETGLLRGAYHFFYAKDDPEAQANHFVQTLKQNTVKPDDLPPVLDVEITDGMDKAKIAERVLICLKAIENGLGQKPIVYTDPGFANEYLTDKALGKYRLWIADYGVKAPTIPQAWKGKTWTMWQHTQTGEVDGVYGHVDLDVFNGSQKDLMALIQDAKTR